MKSLFTGPNSTQYRSAPSNAVGPSGKHLTRDQTKVRLVKTATKDFPYSSSRVAPSTGRQYFSQYDVFPTGAGYFDIMAALTNGSRAFGQAIAGGGSSAAWGTSVPLNGEMDR